MPIAKDKKIMKNDLGARIDKYYKLNTRLMYLDNKRLSALFEGERNTRRWTESHIIKLGRSKVFVKRVPLTDLEYKHMFSTKNLYNLPTYYNYGVDSAGLGTFRELLMHIRTTNWVLQGTIENFPLMYHYRILSRSGEKTSLDLEWYNGYVECWNNDENIGRYVVERANAKYEVALFLEYIRYTFSKWLGKNVERLDLFIDEMLDTITFLRENGIIHFDVHFNNILTDGDKPYLTDLGLVLDKRFDLSEVERTFFRKNTYYDYGEFLFWFGEHLLFLYRCLGKKKKKKIMEKYDLKHDLQGTESFGILLKNINEIHADGLVRLDQDYVETVIKYRDIIMLMFKFFRDMERNNKKDTKYSHAKLRRLLEDTDILYGRTS